MEVVLHDSSHLVLVFCPVQGHYRLEVAREPQLPLRVCPVFGEGSQESKSVGHMQSLFSVQVWGCAYGSSTDRERARAEKAMVARSVKYVSGETKKPYSESRRTCNGCTRDSIHKWMVDGFCLHVESRKNMSILVECKNTSAKLGCTRNQDMTR